MPDPSLDQTQDDRFVEKSDNGASPGEIDLVPFEQDPNWVPPSVIGPDGQVAE